MTDEARRVAMDACQSYRPGGLCRDGFPPVALCSGAVCWSCGKPGKTPHCLNDDFAPPHLIDDTGRPLLAILQETDNAD